MHDLCKTGNPAHVVSEGLPSLQVHAVEAKAIVVQEGEAWGEEAYTSKIIHPNVGDRACKSIVEFFAEFFFCEKVSRKILKWAVDRIL